MTSALSVDKSAKQVVALIIADVLIATLLVVGNVLIISLIQKGQLLGRSTNVFVFSMASADILNGCVSIPSHILSTGYYGQAAVYMCKSLMFSSYISKTVVLYTILFLIVEKSLRILCPTREIVTVGRCMFATSLLWFFAPAFNIWCVVFFTIENETNLESTKQEFDFSHLKRCVLHTRFTHLRGYYLTIFFTVLFAVPFTFSLVLFGILYRKYFSILKERIMTYLFVIKLLLSLYVVAVVCQIPLEIVIFIDNLFPAASTSRVLLFNCFFLLSFTRGIWNVIVYCYFRHFFTKKRHLATIRASNCIKKKRYFEVNKPQMISKI